MGRFGNVDIVPRLNAGYNMGTGLRENNREVSAQIRGNWDGIGGDSRAKDASYLMISPQVDFRFGGRGGQIIGVGYVMQRDLTKDAKPSETVKTMNNLIFVDFRVSF